MPAVARDSRWLRSPKSSAGNLEGCVMRPERMPAAICGWCPWTKVALGVWFVILTAVVTHAACRPMSNSVYPLYSSAARRWMCGTDLYRNLQEAYRYSPLATASLAPFGYACERWGAVLWRLLNAAVLLGGMGWWARTTL